MSRARCTHTLESLRSRVIEVGDCWEWQGYMQNGTPQVVAYPGGVKKMVSVRKTLRELVTGQPQPDGHYSNTCGNHRCVNPEHTLYKSESGHMREMGRKRKVTAVTANKLRKFRVEAGLAKLDESKAQEIRLSPEPAPVLAERFGVSKSWITKIRRGKAWRVLSSPFAGLFK